MAADPDAFLLEEYKALRKEVEIYLQESRALERYIVVAVAAVWVWLITNRISFWVAWLVPVLVTLAGAVRGFAVLAHFRKLGSYLSETEKHFGVKGWEQTGPGRQLANSTQVLDWGLLIISLIGLFSRQDLIPH